MGFGRHVKQVRTESTQGGDGRVQKSHLLVPTRGSAVSPLGCHYYMEPYLEKLADSVIVAVFTGEEMGGGKSLRGEIGRFCKLFFIK